MSKIFQILSNICHWQTPYASIEETEGRYAPDCVFVEAPDYVFEGWGYLDGEFIKPTPPEGWLYDDATGTFYQEGDEPPKPEPEPAPEPDYTAFLAGLMEGYADG